MPISSSLQSDTLLPLFYAEVTSAGEPISENLVLCLVGHMNKSTVADPNMGDGTAVANVMYLLSQSIATTLFGRGSMLEAMYETARKNAPRAEIWAIACQEESTASRSVGTIAVIKPGTRTRTGTVAFHIAGKRVQIYVQPTDTAEKIAQKIQSRINQMPLSVKASGANGTSGQTTVTLKVRWAGITGNDITVSYVGPLGRASASDPAVVLGRYFMNFTQPAGGLGEAEVASIFSGIGSRKIDLLAFPWQGTSSLDACDEFMSNSTGRWSPYQMKYGHMVTSKKAGYQTLYDMLATRNDPHMSVMTVKSSCIPMWEWTSALAGVMIVHWAAPPELSRPLQTLTLEGIWVGTDDDETFDETERQSLLQVGGTTFHCDPDASVHIDRVRTTRKYNEYGDPDPSWADAITMFQAQYFVRAMKAAITNAFPRCALSDVPLGINGFTSTIQIRSVLVHEYRRMAKQGLVENVSLFAQYLVVERDLVDRNRVNVLMRPDFVNQLRVVAAIVETHLELEADDPLIVVDEDA